MALWVPATAKPRLQAIESLPLIFEANRGQTDPQVKFLARGPGYQLFLTPTEVVLVLRQPSAISRQPSASERQDSRLLAPPPTAARSLLSTPPTVGKSKPRSFSPPPKVGEGEGGGAVLRMHFVGANPAPQVVGLMPLPGQVHYFRGSDPRQWRTHIPTYANGKYQAVYPGVDIIFYGHQGHLEYDFLVAPGADPRRIILSFEGADRLTIDPQGDLVLHVGGSYVRLPKPVISQEVDGVRRTLVGGYILKGPKEVGFHVAAYDATRPLVIDPLLVYSSFLGGSDTDEPYSIAVDATGAAYVARDTLSLDFPTVNPVQPVHGGIVDAFIAKVSSDGSTLVYATYLGGSNVDVAYGIAVDAAGYVYITGHTNSPDFPTKDPLQPSLASGNADAFVTKLDPTGSALIYSTYLGGKGPDRGNAIAVDTAGNAYLTGFTASADFPTTEGALQRTLGFQDAFVTKLNPMGSALVYSTYLGGSGSEGGHSITVDAAGNTYVTGGTNSRDFPTVQPLQPALSGRGTVRSSAFDNPDKATNVGITGGPIGCVNTADAFVAKLNPLGTALVSAIRFGGNDCDVGSGIGVDAAGNLFVTGVTYSPDFPTKDPFQPSLRGGSDAFVVKLDPAATFVYSTYLGGSSWETGYSLVVDPAGHAYVTGTTTSRDFPILHPFQRRFGGYRDAFVAKLSEEVIPDTVTIRRAVFFTRSSHLFISATSTATPAAELTVTVPGCVTEAPMRFRAGRYRFRTGACIGLDGQTVTVQSSFGGMATATIR